MTNLIRNLFTNIPVELAVPPSANVVFVCDFYGEDMQGGAELTTEALLEKAPKNLRVFKMHSSSLTTEILGKNKDKLFVFGNYTNIVDVDVFQELATGEYKYWIIEYDFKMCRWRSPKLHTMSTKQPACDCPQQEHGARIKEWFGNAQRMFWMSEQQKNVELERLGLNSKDPKHIVLSSMFSEQTLRDLKMRRLRVIARRQKAAILPDDSTWIKGVEQTKVFCKLRGIEHESLQKLPYSQFLDSLSVYKSFVFMPLDWDTCPRSVIEAKLLGCEVMVNDNTLHAKEEWFANKTPDEVAAYLSNRPKVFWDCVATEAPRSA